LFSVSPAFLFFFLNHKRSLFSLGTKILFWGLYICFLLLLLLLLPLLLLLLLLLCLLLILLFLLLLLLLLLILLFLLLVLLLLRLLLLLLLLLFLLLLHLLLFFLPLVRPPRLSVTFRVFQKRRCLFTRPKTKSSVFPHSEVWVRGCRGGGDREAEDSLSHLFKALDYDQGSRKN